MQQKKKLKIKEFPIKINSNGEWFYNDSLIKREALIKLFSSVLVSDNKGNFFLETPAEKGSIKVEDSPFVVELFNVKGKDKKQKIIFKTNPAFCAKTTPTVITEHRILGPCED